MFFKLLIFDKRFLIILPLSNSIIKNNKIVLKIKNISSSGNLSASRELIIDYIKSFDHQNNSKVNYLIIRITQLPIS